MLKRAELLELVCFFFLISIDAFLIEHAETKWSGDPAVDGWLSPCSFDDWVGCIFVRAAVQVFVVSWLYFASAAALSPLFAHFSVHAGVFACLIVKLADDRESDACPGRRFFFILSIVTGACEFVVGLFILERASRYSHVVTFPGFPEPSISEPLLEGEREHPSHAEVQSQRTGARQALLFSAPVAGAASGAGLGAPPGPGWSGYDRLDGSAPSAYDTAEDDESFRSAKSDLSARSLGSSVGASSSARTTSASQSPRSVPATDG